MILSHSKSIYCMKENIICDFTELLTTLLGLSNEFSYIIRRDYIITEEEKEILNNFKEHLLYEDVVDSWPGTKLLCGKKANIFFYRFNQQSCELLINMNKELYEWQHPYMPEDLCFYKNSIPIFASIAHEKYSYFFS
ncbi:MAG: hypothetical protein Ta2G_03300 [Termitinemataceae bacterium]|nr:MAG: hypothetical protein Ta2G_03300 [Termitinemataceae bacterium]